MNENETGLTGIQLSKATRNLLRSRKIYSRESYEEVVLRLLQEPKTRKKGAGRPRKLQQGFPQPIVELSTEGQESALNEGLDNDIREE